MKTYNVAEHGRPDEKRHALFRSRLTGTTLWSGPVRGDSWIWTDSIEYVYVEGEKPEPPLLRKLREKAGDL